MRAKKFKETDILFKFSQKSGNAWVFDIALKVEVKDYFKAAIFSWSAFELVEVETVDEELGQQTIETTLSVRQSQYNGNCVCIRKKTEFF